MNEATELIPLKQVQLLDRLAGVVGLAPAKYYAAIKATCGCEGANDEHFAVLMMAADRYQLNPMLKQLYLMKTQKGPTVVIPVDGWVPLLVNHHDYLAHDVTLEWEGKPFQSKLLAATCRIWTRTRHSMGMGPFEHSELLSECYKDTGPWKSHTSRMLGHKAIIQGARRAFGIYVMDSDEASGINGDVRVLDSRPYSLPTSTPVPSTDLPSADVMAWADLVSKCATSSTLMKLHGEFDSVREGRAAEDIEAIEAAFSDRLQRLTVVAAGE